MLHKGVLKLLKHEARPGRISLQQRVKSEAALKSAARMIANVARNHKSVENVAILPVTASYSMQEALHYFRDLGLSSTAADKADMEALIVMTQRFGRRWGYGSE